MNPYIKSEKNNKHVGYTTSKNESDVSTSRRWQMFEAYIIKDLYKP